MTKSKKGKSFTYSGGLDAIEIHATHHTYIFNNGEPVEVCPEDVADIKHPDITAGGDPAPAPTPQETEEA